MTQVLKTLGSISVNAFIQRFWGKRPLLIRNAFPKFVAPVGRDDLFALAERDDCESRMVEHTRGRWHLSRGPFDTRALARKARSKSAPWTVLVQDVNHFSAQADALLRQFSFIPAARLDDLMVSYATPGGGVGPHVDSYDVFLLQAWGKRRWRVSQQHDLSLLPNQPLKILKHFKAEEEWILEPGDMLYLPPGVAHEGTAVGECLTYSVGFRAPSFDEVRNHLLDHLSDLESGERTPYRDPRIPHTRHRAEIPASLASHVLALARQVVLRRQGEREFVGTLLTDPKPHVFFDSPARPHAAARFAALAHARGVEVDRRALMLTLRGAVFLNGERLQVESMTGRAALRRLADERSIATAPADVAQALYPYYRAGVIHLLARTSS